MTASHIEIPDRLNVASFFVDRNVAEGRGEKVAFLSEDRTLTYSQLRESVNRVGNALLDLGLEMEQRVLLLLLDGTEFVASFFGAIKMGAVPVPVNTMMRAQDYSYFLNDSRARVAIISQSLLAEAGPILPQAPYLRQVVVVGNAEGEQFPFDQWVAKASPKLDPARTTKDDVAFWLYSSGSTGLPKGVVHLHHDMMISSDTYALQVQGFGGPESVEDLNMKAIGPASEEVRRECLSGRDAEAEGGKIEALLGLLYLEHGRKEGGDAEEDGGLESVDHLEHRLGQGPVRVEHRLGAPPHGEVHVVSQPVGEEEFRRRKGPISVRDAQHLKGVGVGGNHHIVVEVHNPLRKPGGAGGV